MNPNDFKRLKRYHTLHMLSEGEFDDLTQRADLICQTPIAICAHAVLNRDDCFELEVLPKFEYQDYLLNRAMKSLAAICKFGMSILCTVPLTASP